MDGRQCAGIFAERPTEWIAVSNPSAGNQRFCNYVYMYMSALLCNIYAECLCTCTHVHGHVCTMQLYTSLAYLSVCGYTRQAAQRGSPYQRGSPCRRWFFCPKTYTSMECHYRAVVHQICVLMAESSVCGFESWPQPWCLCPWARRFTIIASLHPGVNGYLWGQSWLLCLISPMRCTMAPIELYTPQEAEMVSGMIYAPDEQG